MKILNTKTVLKTNRVNMMCAVTLRKTGCITFSAYFARINNLKKGDLLSFGFDDEGEPLIIVNDPDGFKINVRDMGFAYFHSANVVKQLTPKGLDDFKSVRYFVSKESEDFNGFKAYRIITKSAIVA